MWLWPPLSLVEMLACLIGGLLVLFFLEQIEKRFHGKKKKDPSDQD